MGNFIKGRNFRKVENHCFQSHRNVFKLDGGDWIEL